MAVPEQIRKQTEAVQELYKQLNDEESSDVVVGEAPKADSETGHANDSGSNDEHSSPESLDNDYVQKYKTLQGMYNAEVPRLHATNRDLQGRVSQLEQLLSSLSAPQQSQAQQLTAHQAALLSETEREEYGESLDVMRKVSKEELNPLVNRIHQLEAMLGQVTNNLNTSVMPAVQHVARQQANNAEDRFWSDLNSTVPNWQRINTNPDFQSWLLEVDPMTGVSRQTYLQQAQDNLDSRRVAVFFDSWARATGNETIATAQPTRSASASELERQVSPGRGRGTGAPSGQSTKTYTPLDIKSFFNDVRSGKYKGRETERDRIERDIFAAQREGRIVANA
jgi:hypothetical protein